MRTLDLVGVGAAVLFVVAGSVLMPSIWRNERGHDPDRPPAMWGFGIVLWRATVRLVPLSVPACLVGVAVVLTGAGGDESPSPVSLIAGFASLVLLALIFSVALFNRPKSIVAPHLRHQPGALAEWLGQAPAPTPPPKGAHPTGPGPKRD